MEIKRVLGIYFSPVDSTRKIVQEAVESLAQRLQVPSAMQSYTTPSDRADWQPLASGDLVVWGSPVYAGRLPNKSLPFVQSLLSGKGNPVVTIAVFGGRSFDYALAEMASWVEQSGMHLVAAAALVSRHVFSHSVELGRPSKDDLASLRQFCLRVDPHRPSAPTVPFQGAELQYYTPLREDSQPARFLKAKPVLDPDRCMVCGICVRRCPMGSIVMSDAGRPQVEGVCIKCMSCVRRCPELAWQFTDADFLSHTRMVEALCKGGASNWFSNR